MADGTLAAEDEPTVGAEVLAESDPAVAGAGSFEGINVAAVVATEVMDVIEKALLQRSFRVMRQARPVFADGSSIRGSNRGDVFRSQAETGIRFLQGTYKIASAFTFFKTESKVFSVAGR